MVQRENHLEIKSESELDEDVDMSYDDVNNFLKNMICSKRIIKD